MVLNDKNSISDKHYRGLAEASGVLSLKEIQIEETCVKVKKKTTYTAKYIRREMGKYNFSSIRYFMNWKIISSHYSLLKNISETKSSRTMRSETER